MGCEPKSAGAEESALRELRARLAAGEEKCRRLESALTDAERQCAAARAATEEAERARLELAESEARHRFITENVHDVIWQADAELRLTYISPSDRRMRGYLPEEALGRSVLDFMEPASAQRVRDVLQQFLLDMSAGKPSLEEGRRIEIEQYRRDGGTLWTEVVASPLLDRQRKLIGFQGVTRDIAERKRLDQERLALERRLMRAEKNESLGVMAAGIAHDFNNLMMTVIGNAEMALHQLPPDAEPAAGLHDILSAGRRAAELSRQMLTYAGQGLLHPKPVSLAEAARQALDDLRERMPARVEVTLVAPDDLPPVRGDAAALRQALQNVLTNALEALERQTGRIQLTLRAGTFEREALPDDLGAHERATGPCVVIEARDSGAGMNERTLTRIFEPFFSSKFTGRGLGLPATLGIVRQHFGLIHVNSAPGQGTLVRILLPTADNRAAAGVKHPIPPPHAAAGASRPATRLILLADDEESLRKTVGRMLTRLGYEVLAAADGAEAVRAYREYQDDIALVLLDYSMPHMDGLQVLREIRRLNPAARVILSSGYSKSQAAPAEDQPAPDAFIRKPYELDELRRLLASLLEEKNNQQTNNQ